MGIFLFKGGLIDKGRRNLGPSAITERPPAEAIPILARLNIAGGTSLGGRSCGCSGKTSVANRSGKMSLSARVTLNQNEQTRLKLLNSVMVGQLPVAQAAELLGVSERHVWRVLAAYRSEGAAALVHGNRGRRPANATSEAAIADVLRLATTRYSGTNHTHLSELLMEREGIALSRSTVRRIALSAGVTSPRRRRSPRHRVRRKRMPQAGMLVQIDGSHHRWLEGRGPSFALLLAVDDATSTVPYALFQVEEDARGYLMLMEGLIQRSGIPLAVYSDRHAVFKHPGEPRQKLPGPTQFARAMQQLGIRQIFARSPQAKGRVERAAGTFQDRLVTELRLARVETMDQANEILHRYLPRFDRQFGVPAAQSEVAYRPPETAAAVEQALCFRYRRKVAKDNTVKYRWRTLQLLRGGVDLEWTEVESDSQASSQPRRSRQWLGLPSPPAGSSRIARHQRRQIEPSRQTGRIPTTSSFTGAGGSTYRETGLR